MAMEEYYKEYFSEEGEKVAKEAAKAVVDFMDKNKKQWVLTKEHHFNISPM